MPSESSESAYPTHIEWQHLDIFDEYESGRCMFRDVNRTIVREAVAQHVKPSDALILDLGSGVGEAATLVQDDVRRRLIQVEQTPAYVKESKRRNPDANVVTAKIDALPFTDGSVDAVISYSVWDTLRDPAKARDEVARVLKVDGKFLHFLDLSPNIVVILEELEREGKVCFPNPFRQLTSPSTKADDEMVYADRSEIEDVQRKLDPRNPSDRALKMVLDTYLCDPITQSLMLIGSPNTLKGVSRIILLLYEEYGVALHPLYAGRYFKSKMERLFNEGNFGVVESAFHTKGAIEQRDERFADFPRSSLVANNIGRMTGKGGERVQGVLSHQVKVESTLHVLVAKRER